MRVGQLKPADGYRYAVSIFSCLARSEAIAVAIGNGERALVRAQARIYLFDRDEMHAKRVPVGAPSGGGLDRQ